jgi:hypothetical protein
LPVPCKQDTENRQELSSHNRGCSTPSS